MIYIELIPGTNLADYGFDDQLNYYPMPKVPVDHIASYNEKLNLWILE